MADSNWGWNEKSENMMNLGFFQSFELPHLCDTLPRPKVLKNTPKSACLFSKLSNLEWIWETMRGSLSIEVKKYWDLEKNRQQSYLFSFFGVVMRVNEGDRQLHAKIIF